MLKEGTKPKKGGSRVQNHIKGRASIFEILFGKTLSRARSIIISAVIARTL